MEKLSVALVGTGGISQIFRIPALQNIENVELVALCDVDEAKVSLIADKYDINKVYFDFESLINKEQLDGIFICTPNNFHYPMALATLKKGIPTFVEKPMALNFSQAKRLTESAKNANVPLVMGMSNRFRDDAIILKDFMNKDELGVPYYIKTGWLRHWNLEPQQSWLFDKKISGGGVLMDIGIQLIDLSLWLLNNPKVMNVRSFNFNVGAKEGVEDSALAVLQTEENVVITVEVAWRLHLEKDMHYTHVFGEQGSAFLNPLRLFKDMHGSLVNVTPVHSTPSADVFKSAFVLEILNFLEVIRGNAEPVTPAEDAIYLMRIMDALYESAEQGVQIDLD